MNEEVKKALEELKASLGKNVEAQARVEQIEALARTADADVKVLKAEIEKIKADHLAREAKIAELQRMNRVAQAETDPLRNPRRAVEMLGMIARQALAQHLRCEVPTRFQGEAALIREFSTEMERADPLAAGATPGSYLVPTITSNQLIDALEQVSDLLGEVDFIPGLPAAGTILIPTLTSRPTLQPKRATVATAMTESTPGFGYASVSPKEAYIFFGVDNALIEMSAIALGEMLNGLLRDAYVEGICSWLVLADASASYNSIRGILAENTADYLLTLPGGKTAFADLTAANLFAMKAKSLKRGRVRGKWLMSEDVFGQCCEFDRQGKVPVVTYDPDGTPRILRNPVVIDESMPDSADSAKDTGFIGFGDLATYLVGMISGIRIATDSSYRFGNNQTCFRAVSQMDIVRKPVKTFILGKTAAA